MGSRFRRSGLVLCACLAACTETGGPAHTHAPPDSAAGDVAFDFAGPGATAIVVPVHINGAGPFHLILDTGATFTCLDSTVSAGLGLPARRSPRGIGIGVGKVGRFDLVTIDTLRVGGASATNLGACVLDLTQFRRLGLDVDGLLGLNFLKSFRVSLDFRRRVLNLRSAGGP